MEKRKDLTIIRFLIYYLYNTLYMKNIHIKFEEDAYDQIKELAVAYWLKPTWFVRLLIAKAMKENNTPNW